MTDFQVAVVPETALLVLDLQRDFLEADGRMPIAASQVGPLLRSRID